MQNKDAPVCWIANLAWQTTTLPERTALHSIRCSAGAGRHARQPRCSARIR